MGRPRRRGARARSGPPGSVARPTSTPASRRPPPAAPTPTLALAPASSTATSPPSRGRAQGTAEAGRKRQRVAEAETPDQNQNQNQNHNRNQNWLQCDKCHAWRMVTEPEVQLYENSEVPWECALNRNTGRGGGRPNNVCKEQVEADESDVLIDSMVDGVVGTSTTTSTSTSTSTNIAGTSAASGKARASSQRRPSRSRQLSDLSAASAGPTPRAVAFGDAIPEGDQSETLPPAVLALGTDFGRARPSAAHMLAVGANVPLGGRTPTTAEAQVRPNVIFYYECRQI